jgi:hypothetical protein
LDRKWTSFIIWPRDRASISVQQLRIVTLQEEIAKQFPPLLTFEYNNFIVWPNIALYLLSTSSLFRSCPPSIGGLNLSFCMASSIPRSIRFVLLSGILEHLNRATRRLMAGRTITFDARPIKNCNHACMDV